MQALLHKLAADFPTLNFQPGEQFCWSPEEKQVTFKLDSANERIGQWALLHEVAHALLGHNTYASDFELLQLEVAAWEKARQLAPGYGCEINADHIQDCLDTYRDWLHRRSTCPTCGNRSLQETHRQYSCFNCDTKWHVTASRFCRPYRRLQPSEIKKSPAHEVKQATFS
jgi:hypothetical protein